MVLRRFRAEISIQENSSKRAYTPEFYRKISYTDTGAQKSQKNINDNFIKADNDKVEQSNPNNHEATRSSK